MLHKLKVKAAQILVGAILLVSLGGAGWAMLQRVSGFQPSWQVVNVHDGDTIKVRQGNRVEKVRFACVDAPELSQPLGKASRDNLQRLIDQSGDRVTLKILDRDRYGRQVAEVYTTRPKRLLQEAQIQAGMAYVYHRYLRSCPDAAQIKRAEAIARQMEAGVWKDPSAVKPWNYRHKP